MKINKSASINIIRDEPGKFAYYPTENSKIVCDQVLRNFHDGNKTCLLLGSYGTGKSSFLLAFESDIIGVTNHFTIENKIKSIINFSFIKLIGEYKSFRDSIIDLTGLEIDIEASSKEILTALDIKLSKKDNKSIIIVDEFGKHLEYASKNNPEKELYFLQEFSEFVNNRNNNLFFIGTLHQNFSAYSYSLTTSQRNEWDKVKGRFVEISFNEPVEQLLFLAAKQINGNQSKIIDKNIGEMYRSIDRASIFPLKDYFNIEIAKALFPLDILAASILTLSMQKYGQNERSLFSFLNSNDHLSLAEFDNRRNTFFSISEVYDYLNYHFFSYINSKYNPHFSQWNIIQRTIERVEKIFDKNSILYVKIIKVVGLIGIFTREGAKCDLTFLKSYIDNSFGINYSEELIKKLEMEKLIRYQKYNNRYVLFEGTDVDIEIELIEAEKQVESNFDIAERIKEYFDFSYVLAKENYYNLGTPRYFEYYISESPIKIIPQNEIDGYINLIINKNIDLEEVRRISDDCKEAILYCFFNTSDEIYQILFDLEKLKYLKNRHHNDKVALNQIDELIDDSTNNLNYKILKEIYDKKNLVTWIFDGEIENISSNRQLNKVLSRISSNIYFKTPQIKNELINRTKLSTPISTARNNLLRHLQYHDKEDLSFLIDKNPPEKTIYLSLIKNNGIHKKLDGKYFLSAPTENLTEIWEQFIEFIDSSKDTKRNLNDFVTELSNKPFKLKRGVVEFILPVFLFAQRESYALFDQDSFIPEISFDVLELIVKKPRNYFIKSYDLSGIKEEIFKNYMEIISYEGDNNNTNKLFIETIKPFLTFYRQLNYYSKNTKRLSKEAIKIRESIRNSKDPETTFFHDFPLAIGTTLSEIKDDTELISTFFYTLKNTLKDIASSYDELISRIEAFLSEKILGTKSQFPEIKIQFQQRYKNLKSYMLLNNQKALLNRINSKIDDKNAWITSISSTIIGKQLDKISDEEELKLYVALKDKFKEFDNLLDLTKEKIDKKKEQVFSIEFTSIETGTVKQNFRINKKEINDLDKIESKVLSLLNEEKIDKKTVLAKLLLRLINEKK